MNMLDSLKKTVGLKNSGAKELEMDILDKLKQEHEEVADLLQKLMDSERSVERKSLFNKIKSALIPHLRAEETVVYDAILVVKDKKANQDGEEGYLEHGLANKMLTTLGKIQNAMSIEFSAASKVLKELIEHHVKEEENNVWKDIKKYFSKDDRIEMNRRFETAKKRINVS